MSSRHRMASLTSGTRSRMTSTSQADHAIRQRAAQTDPLAHASGEAPRPTDGRRSRRGMRSRASFRLRRLKADRGPAAITHDEPHARATEKRQLIFAVGQSVPHRPRASVTRESASSIPAGRSFTCAKRKRRSSRVAACSTSFSPSVVGIWAKVALRRLMGYAAPRAVRRRSPSGHWVSGLRRDRSCSRADG